MIVYTKQNRIGLIMKLREIGDVVIGGWLVIVSFIPFSSTFIVWHNLVIGILISVSGIALYSLSNSKGTILALVGFWLIISAYLPFMVLPNPAMTNYLVTGIIILLAAFPKTFQAVKLHF
jgi:hypothetical protein